MFQQKEAIAR